MTATIAPLPGIPALVRTDPELRLRDYQEAFAFYASLLGDCFDAIIFAENSNSDVSAIAPGSSGNRIAASNVEFMSFYGLDYPPAWGRGYGEFKLVDYAMEHSKLMQPDDVVWKVTGRYVIGNVRRIVETRPSTADVYCHMRNFRYRLCELYLLAWTKRGYESVIKGIYPKLRNDIIPNVHTIEETLFRKIVDQSFTKVEIVPRFRVVPIVRGIRGWNNSQYSSPWSLKLIARRLAHTFTPSIWI
jgi:hypothetical protein